MFTRQTSSRLRVSGTAAAVALSLAVASSAAFAASTATDSKTMPAPATQTAAAKVTPAERCKVYERHFDAAVVDHANAPRIDEARTLRIEGGKLCSTGEYTRGSFKLREALDMIDIGVPF